MNVLERPSQSLNVVDNLCEDVKSAFIDLIFCLFLLFDVHSRLLPGDGFPGRGSIRLESHLAAAAAPQPVYLHSLMTADLILNSTVSLNTLHVLHPPS